MYLRGWRRRNSCDILTEMKERKGQTTKRTGAVVEESMQEKEYQHLVGSWSEGKISYETLVRNRPSHELTVPARVLRSILDKL